MADVTDKDRRILDDLMCGQKMRTITLAEAHEAIATARAEGAAEEREACLSDIQCADSACNYATTAGTALADAGRRIRARGEAAK